MYQLVVTVRELDDGYRVLAVLGELLPGGGVAPVADRRATLAAGPSRALPDPFVGILQSLVQFAASELQNVGVIGTDETLF